MKNIQKTASSLHTYLHVIHVLLSVIIVIMTVCLGLIAAYFLFDLEPWMIGSDYNQVDFGFLTLTVAEQYVPDMTYVFLTAAGEMVAAIIVSFFCQKLISCFLAILAPMREGSPFTDIVSTNLKKAAKFSIVLGILVNIAQLYEDLARPLLYGLPNLMLSEKIVHVSIHNVFDLSFLLVAAVLYLLSCVFRYGEALQQLSDETL